MHMILYPFNTLSLDNLMSVPWSLAVTLLDCCILNYCSTILMQYFFCINLAHRYHNKAYDLYVLYSYVHLHLMASSISDLYFIMNFLSSLYLLFASLSGLILRVGLQMSVSSLTRFCNSYETPLTQLNIFLISLTMSSVIIS